MDKIYGIIYETTNLVNGMKYIGRHKLYNGILEDGYLGSGVYLTNALNKYGRENFSRIVLCKCYSEEELNEKEEYFLTMYNCAENPAYYNSVNCSYLGGTSGLKHSNETKTRMSISATLRGISEETRSKMMETRNSHSEDKKSEIKRKQSESHKSLVAITNGVSEKRIPASDLDDYLQNGWRLGRLPMSNETKQKISQSLEGNVQTDATKQKKSESMSGKIWIYKDSERSLINPDQLGSYITEGWSIGTPEEFSRKRSEDVSGKVHIHKGDEQKFVYSEELESYLNNGWSKGLSQSHKENLRKSCEGRIWVQNGIKAIKISQDELQDYLDRGYVRGQKLRPIN